MLFDASDRERIHAGSVTVTYRLWRAPQARAGGIYRFDPGRIVAESVETVLAGDISDAAAAQAGFAGAEALLQALRRRTGEPIGPGTLLWRVAFRYEDAPAPPSRTKTLDPDAILSRLSRADAASGTPWTAATLAAIAARPRTPARLLAANAGMETLPFKANVRKLKALGLTLSHEVGYEVTALGRDVLGLLGVGG
ncbi:MAG: hypothetical protein IT302_13570 [Dehalococcoidia bacterium]|nr:hypothetical protein [Dehalococcoidia bacterium]